MNYACANPSVSYVAIHAQYRGVHIKRPINLTNSKAILDYGSDKDNEGERQVGAVEC